MVTSAVERFLAKCEFMAGSGCVIWRGATSKSNAGKADSPAFWFEGKRWPARRWAAIHIHGLEVSEAHNVQQTCGEPLCVQHLDVVVSMPRNIERQNYLLEQLGYGEEQEQPEKPRPEHGGVPFHSPPRWLVNRGETA